MGEEARRLMMMVPLMKQVVMMMLKEEVEEGGIDITSLGALVSSISPPHPHPNSSVVSRATGWCCVSR
jgi:hypothetical protein